MNISTKEDQPKRQPITFSPNLDVDDVYADYWMKQVTIRLRREIQWSWHEMGITKSSYSQDPATLPPISNTAFEALTQTRNWEKKNTFFKMDATIKYLTEQLQRPIPNRNNIGIIRGSFGWVIETLKLNNTSAFVLALGLATAFDSAVGSVISACLNDPSKIHPTLSLAQKLWDSPEQIMTVVDAAHPLNRYGLIRYSSQSGHIHSEVGWDDKMEVPSLISNLMLFPNSPIPEFLQEITTSGNNEDFADTDASSIVAARLRDKNQEKLHVVPVFGEKYSSHQDIVRGIGKLTDRKIVEFVGDPRLLEDIQYLNSLATLCWMKDMDLYLGKEVVSTLTRQKQPADINFLPLQSIPLTIFLGITERHQLENISDNILLPVVNVPRLSYYERIKYWKKTLGEKANGLDETISESSRRFRYEKESINAISRGLKNFSKPISDKDFVDACRAEIEIDFGDLAQRVSPRFEDEDLILPPKQSIQFQEIINAMRSLTKVHYGIGTARAWNESGIFVLFSGPSGSGKTMAAEILALKLNLLMYRIDLSQVQSEYVGVTTKHLKKVFDTAEVSSDILVFFDEADSIFGRRTEVKDAHDMYANQQVSYLLERIERFKGLAVLATNRKKDLDEAFARRLHYVIDFPFPGVSERTKIWRQVIPKGVDASELDIDFLAKNFQLSGGNIRSIIFNTCLQCVNACYSDEKLKYKPTMEQVIIAVRREYEKLGRTISLEQFGQYGKILKKIGYD